MFLRASGRLDYEQIDAIDERIEESVTDAVEKAEAVEPDPDEMFDHAYADKTENLRRQQAYLRRLRDEFGDEKLLDD